MRAALVCLLLTLAITQTSHAMQERTAWPQTVILEFEGGLQIVLKPRGVDEYSSFALRRAAQAWPLPEGVCSRLRGIRLETVVVRWIPSRTWSAEPTADPASADLWIAFSMGSEAERAFGELPEVALRFTAGQFSGGTVSRKTSPAARSIEHL